MTPSIPPANSSQVSPVRYSAIAQWLHWLLTAGMVYTFGIGWIMTGLKGISVTKLHDYSYHKWAGVTLFALALLRILYRAFKKPPPLPLSLKSWEVTGSRGMHVLLLTLTLVVPLTGYLYTFASGFPVVYFGIWPLPAPFGRTPEWEEPLRLAHAWTSYLLGVAVLLHATAALLHHFKERDTVLVRMLPSWFKARAARS